MSASSASLHLKKMNAKLHEEYDGDDMFTWQYAVYDAWLRGKGPLGFLFGFGYYYIAACKVKKKITEKFGNFMEKR